MTSKSSIDWNDPNLVFPRPEDAPLIGDYALVTAASTATQRVYLNGWPANKSEAGGANFYSWPDMTVRPTKYVPQPGAGGGSEPSWQPAWEYPSDLIMVDDLQAHQFANQVKIDGNQVQAFVSGFGPALNYWTKGGGPQISQTPNVDAGGGGQPGGGGGDTGGGSTTDGVVLPWGGEVRTGEAGAPQMAGDDLYILHLTVPADWPKGPNGNTISIAEHGASGGTQLREVKLLDDLDSVLCTSLDTYNQLPYIVADKSTITGVAALAPGGHYRITVVNKGERLPPVANFIAHCYTPVKGALEAYQAEMKAKPKKA